jgi:hypothetical protein
MSRKSGKLSEQASRNLSLLARLSQGLQFVVSPGASRVQPETIWPVPVGPGRPGPVPDHVSG